MIRAAEERRKTVKAKKNIVMLCIMGILIALEIVLANYATVHTWDIKIGFSFVPIVAAAALYGPIAGGLVGAIGDVISAMLFPVGPFFPGFTVTAFLTGAVFGLFLYKKESALNAVLSVLVTQAVISQFINTYFISVLYGNPYWPLFVTRLAQTAAMSAVQLVFVLLMSKKLIPVLKKRFNIQGKSYQSM